MGVRGEIFSNKVSLQNRTYFFNVKEVRLGDLYLNIVESKKKDTGGFDRQSVVLFADDLTDFLKGFDDSLRVLEKAAREKKRGSDSRGKADGRADRQEKERGDERGGEARPAFGKGAHRKESGAYDRPKTDRSRGEAHAGGKTGAKVFKRSGTGKAPFKSAGPKGAPYKGGSFPAGPAKGPRKGRVVKAVRRDDGPREGDY